MASIAHKHADIEGIREQQGCYHVGLTRDIYSVADIVPQGARLGLRRKWVAALVCKVCLHDRRRRVQAVQNA